MARYLTVCSDRCVLLNFNKGAYLAVVANFAAIEVDELRQLYTLAELDIRDAGIQVHNKTIVPFSLRDRSTASSILTTRQPAVPSLMGVRSLSMQSMKYSSSVSKASVCSSLGTHISPER